MSGPALWMLPSEFQGLFLQRISVDDDPFRKVQSGKDVFRECRI
ncbi:hypothetical protein Pan110_36850 [Gimesia panareensis]|nr:hypothetical protein Pan110_36850 [Gimesia panareensis]